MSANEESNPAVNPLESATREPLIAAPGIEPKPRRSLFAFLRPSSQSAFSATLLLMVSTFLSGLLGLVRTKYINHIFGAGPETDAYNAAFQLPDMLAYFLVGGVVSISLVTILSRYRAQSDEAGADRRPLHHPHRNGDVLLIGIVLAEIFAPYYTHIAFRGFDPHRAALCTTLTRLLLPAQLFFFFGGVIGSRLLVRKIFLYQAISPLIYNPGIILGAVFLHQRFGISLPRHRRSRRSYSRPRHPQPLRRTSATASATTPILNLRHPAFLEWLRLTFPLMIGVSLVTADKWILSYFASNDVGGISLLTVAKTLFTAPMGILGQAAGAASLPFFSALYSQNRLDDFAAAVNRSVSRVIAAVLPSRRMDDRPRQPDRRSPTRGSFTPAEPTLPRSTSPSSPSPSPSGRHRESTPAPSTPPATPSPPPLPAWIVTLRLHPHLRVFSSTPSDSKAWPSHPTSASSSRPSPSRSSSTAAN